MPLYEYKCTTCHKHVEKIQKFSDPEITICPHCGGVLERVISAPAISFKGGGWFKDGYGSAKPAAASGESADKPAATSDSKPAASSESSTAPAPAAPAATPAPAAKP